MALASLTVDLTLALAKFESDSGKASQIITRDQEKMSRAALTFQRALERQSDQATKTNAELQTLKGASLGVSDDVLAKIPAGGSSFAAIGTQGTAAFKAIGAAAASAAAETDKLLSTAVAKIREVNQQAAALKLQAVAENSAGTLTDDGLKVRLAGITQIREATIREINDEFTRDKAARQAAAAEAAAGEARRAQAQKIIDVQNGLTATYRTQLQALRELRDAGNLSPQQFKTASTELVNKQPGVQARTAASAEADAAAKASAAQALATALAGNASATAAAQSQVYLAALVAQAAAAQSVAEAEARQAAVTKAVGDATARGVAEQRAAYEAKTAYIAKVTEEAQALFRTRDAQRQLDAERAGVSSQQAAQLAKFSGDREFIATIYAGIDAEQKFAAEFGKTAAEILKQDAATRGLTNTTASAIARFEALSKSNAGLRTAAATQQSNDAFLASLQKQIDLTGKARSEIVAMELAERGLSDAGAPLLAKLRDIDAQTGQLGKGAFATRNQLLTLKYTISDVVASAASGISPLTILLQQGGQVAQIEGGISGVFKTVLSLVTPARLAVAAFGGAVAAIGYAYLEGAKQSKEFNDGVVLSGNYAGLTEGRFNALAKSVASSGQITASAARDIGQALLATGEIGPRAFAVSEEAGARFAAATGKTAKDVAAQFASITRDVYAGAVGLNQSLNFLTASQLQQVRSLQDAGKSTEAYSLVVTALNDRLKNLEPNLGTIDKILRGVTSTWKGFWDAAYDIGRNETIEGRIKRAEDAAASLNKRLADGRSSNPAFSSAPALRDQDPEELARVAKLAAQKNDEVTELKRVKILQDNVAASVAETAELDKKATAASDYYRAAEKGAKAAAGQVRELAEEQRQYDALVKRKATDPNVELPTAQTRAAIQKRIRESYTDKPVQGEANAQRKALLDQDLKNIKDAFGREQEVLQFNQQVVSAIYSSGTVSLRDYYDERRKITADGVQAEADELKKEQARLQRELDDNKFKDPHERIQLQTQLNESVDKSAKLQREASRQAILANLEEAAAFKQLNDRVEEYRANLLQLQGDEEGAAKIRSQTAIQNAKLFAKQSGGLISDADIANQTRAIEAANAIAEAQRRIGLASTNASRAEEAYAIVASRVGASLYEQDTAVYAIRVKLVEQLKDAAGKTQALADAERRAADAAGRVADPRVLATAADAAVQYAKALDTIDPALNRLRDSAKSTADGIADNIGNAINEFKGFPDLFNNISKTIQQAGTKFFVTDPLKVGLENVFKSVSEGDNPIGNFLKSAVGVKGGGAGDAQTAAVKASTSALVDLQLAASNAAAALGGNGGTTYGSIPALFASEGKTAVVSAPVADVGGLSAKDLGGYFEPVRAEAAASARDFGKSVDGLVTSTVRATSSMGGLPGVIGQLATSLYTLLFSTQASAGSGAGGGIRSFFTSLFGGGSGSSAAATFASDDALALFFHSGGVVGSGGARGSVPASVFAGAQVLHSGGLAGLKSDEVPAILRRREEVIRRDDPRHRDNGGMRGDREMAVTFNNSFAERTTRETINQMNAKQQVQLDRAKRTR